MDGQKRFSRKTIRVVSLAVMEVALLRESCIVSMVVNRNMPVATPTIVRIERVRFRKAYFAATTISFKDFMLRFLNG